MDNKFVRIYVEHQQKGMTDAEILDLAAQSSTYGPSIIKAREKGLGDRQILVGLGNGDLASIISKPEPEGRPFMAGVGRGLEDVAAGALDLLPDVVAGDSIKGFLANSQARANTYDEANKDIGFDGGRVLGQAAALLPLGLASPSAAASTGARVSGNAALGAASGYIPRAKDESERLGNAALGAVAGAAIPEVVRAGVGQAVQLKNAAKAALSGNNVGQMVDDVMSRIGQQSDEAAAQVRQYLTGLATDQIKAGGQVSPEILERAAKIASVDPNIRPTLGQLTRNPDVLSAERNLAGSGTKAGNLVAERYRAQDSVLRDASRRLEDSTGGQKLSQYAYGEKAGGFLRGKWKEMQSEIGKAYKAVEEAHGAATVDVSGLVRQVADKAYTEGSETANGKMATIALNKLKSYGLFDSSGNLKEGASLSIQQMRDLRQSLSGVDGLSGMTPAQAINAKTGIVNAIDDAVESSPVGDVFKPARAMARQRFSEFADRTLRKVQSDGIPDEGLFELATGRNVDTAKDYVRALSTGTPDQVAAGGQIMADTRRKMIADILSKGESGLAGEETLLPKSLKNAIDPMRGGYDPEVLDTVLGDQAGKLRDLVDVVGILRADPSHNSINYSKSGALLSGMVDGGKGLANRVVDVGGTGNLIGMAAKAASERQQDKLAKALLQGSPNGLPGFGRAQVVEALTANPPRIERGRMIGSAIDQAVSPETYRSMLIDALMGGSRTAGATAAAGANRR